jgi:hypothetical protein
MTADWVSTINSHLPLRIKWLSWEDPTLVLRGADWNFTCTSAWRIVESERMIGGCEDDAASSVIERLRGGIIVKCESLTESLLGDLRLVVSDGVVLEVFVASTTDPWAFRLPEGPTVIPSPSAPNWFSPRSG